MLLDPAELGPALQRARTRRGLTQAQLAQRAQLSRIFVAKVEAGERMPSWDTLSRLAGPLKITVRVALVRQRR